MPSCSSATKSSLKPCMGLILAAGIGSRMRPEGDDHFIKPLTSVDQIILLERTLKSLEVAGCRKIVIVVGWQAETIKGQINVYYRGPMELEFVYNDKFDLNNGISVLCARDYLDEPFILTMSDHILDPKIMESVRRHSPLPNGACLCVDFKLNTIFDIDDATKVLTKNGKIGSIGKHLTHYDCVDTGVFICTKGLMDAIEHVYQETGDASLTQGVQLLADKGLMEYIDIKDAYWQDVDTLEMLQHAEALLREYGKMDIRDHNNPLM